MTKYLAFNVFIQKTMIHAVVCAVFWHQHWERTNNLEGEMFVFEVSLILTT